jgi:NAD(P)-dependent dehydrogenase (short-subunit alcohol dehydrogenase family)
MANQTAAALVVDQLAALGSKAAAICGDVSRESDVLRLFEAAERTLEPVRKLFACIAMVTPLTHLQAAEDGPPATRCDG